MKRVKGIGPSGRPVTKWQRCAASDPGVAKREDEHFTIEVHVNGVRTLRVRSFTLREKAEAHAKTLRERVERGEATNGPTLADHQARPLTAHADDWLAALEAKGRAPGYIRIQKTRIHVIINGTGWKRLSQISAPSFQDWRDRTAKAKGWSARTQNHYRDTIAAFGTWCSDSSRGRLASNPIEQLESVEGQKSFTRRAATPIELSYFFAALPRKFWLGYAFALTSGLRRNEINTLTWGNLFLDVESPFVRPAREIQKSRREDVIALHPVIVRELQNRRPTKVDEDAIVKILHVPCIKSHWRYLSAARQLFIEQAGDADDRREREASDVCVPVDRRGAKADFHSMRVTFCSQLQADGASLDDAMRLMRHTDRKLTAAVYTDHARLIDSQRRTVSRLALPGTVYGPIDAGIASQSLAGTGVGNFRSEVAVSGSEEQKTQPGVSDETSESLDKQRVRQPLAGTGRTGKTREKWAVRDSNPRHLPCKGSALAN
jgi:integrase